MTNILLQKVSAFIEKNHMLDYGDHVVLGISGGADSMCLLFVLKKLMPVYGLTLTAVHINHGLRGAAADADEAYVESICAQWGIQYVCFREDIHMLAKKEKMTEEEAGRKFRYDCFESVREMYGAKKIAVAHHINDLAETVLFNMFRGSYLKGMGGIAPVRAEIIRPLLCLERSEIESLLDHEQIAYCTDHTNFDTNYTRNKIRLELLPYICDQINPKAIAHIAEAAQAAREAYSFICSAAARKLSDVMADDGGLDAVQMTALEEVLQKEIIRLWFEQKTGKLKDITREHVESIQRLLKNKDGKSISLPYGVCAVRERGRIYLRTYEKVCLNDKMMDTGNNGIDIMEGYNIHASGSLNPISEVIDITIGENIVLKNPQIAVTFEVIDKKENQRIPQNDCTKWFDYDKIYDGLQLRHRRSGDFMTISPNNSKKTLRRVMIDDKIPKDLRENIWLLADGAHVLWLFGGRISEHYKVTNDTQKILVVKIKGEKTCQTKSVCY